MGSQPRNCAMMRRMLRVGLTGNIGTGKSASAQILARLGAHLIDADRIVHELLARGTCVYEQVLAAFGGDILQPDGAIDRNRLGQLVFRASEKRALLNSLLHPEVRAEVQRRISAIGQENPHGIVVVEAALMVETGYYRSFDRLIVITCDAEIQMKRVSARDGMPVEDIRARMAAQMPGDEKAKVADYRIDNSGSMEDLRNAIEAVFRDLVHQEKLLASNLNR